MSIPTAVFLDTSIFDGQQYNFESTALSTFVPVCKERGLTLLLSEAMQGVSYYHEDESVEVYDVDIGEITTVEPSIVAIGDNECTISFYTALTPRVTLRFYHETEHGSEPGEITERDDVELEGTAKVAFDDHGKVSAVTLVSFNETEVRLRVSPWRRW